LFSDALKPDRNRPFDQVEGSLLLRPNFVAKSENSRRGDRVPYWKAGTLPLSYSRKTRAF
jgi:hypothetical protein